MKYIITAAAIFGLFSCRSNEIGNSKDVNPDAIYQEYNITAKEGDANASFTAQFRFGGINGTTLVLNDESFVSLDGKKLAVDSNTALGAFYETYLPISGNHSWLFSPGNEKNYTNSCNLQAFSLITPLSKTFSPADLELQFSGIKDGEQMMISVMDTSNLSSYQDLDTTVTIRDGKALITKSQLQRLAPGPIFFDIAYNSTNNLTNATKEGGAINYSYELKRREAILRKP